MATLKVQELDAQRAWLLKAVEDGEEVVIERQGVPVARLALERAAEPFPARGLRRLGIYEGQAVVHDPNWDAPMSDDELREMLGDDYVDGGNAYASESGHSKDQGGLFEWLAKLSEGIVVNDPIWHLPMTDAEIRDALGQNP